MIPYRNSAAECTASRAVVEPVIAQRRPVAAVFAEPPPPRGGVAAVVCGICGGGATRGRGSACESWQSVKKRGGGGNRYLTSINLALSLLVVLAVGFLIWQASTFFKAIRGRCRPEFGRKDDHRCQGAGG